MIKYFFCPGAQKSGTTTLHDLLSQHPEICLPEIKETKYLLNDIDTINVNQYHSKYYKNCINQRIFGEIDKKISQIHYLLSLYKTL